MKAARFYPKFVEEMPGDLEAGWLYISIRYRTAAHLCACGCGTRVITPIKPAKWQLTYNGEVVSLSPSIDRSQSPCGSHYWICSSVAAWERPLKATEAARVRERDAKAVRAYYESRAGTPRDEFPAPSTPPRSRARSLWQRLRRR